MRINTGTRLTRLLKPVCICLLIAALLGVPTTPVVTGQSSSNAGQIQLTVNPEGISGTYANAGKVYSFESTFISKRALRARILRPDNSVMVECLREGEAMTVNLPTGSLVIDMVKPVAFSGGESKR